MRLALWPHLPLQPLGFALRGAGVTEVQPLAPAAAVAALRDGTVDLALVPTLAVLREPDAFDLLPDVGVVSEEWPYARLLVGAPLDAIAHISFSPLDVQEALLAQVLLAEHYGLKPTFHPRASDDLAAAWATRDAVLVCGADAPTVTPPPGWLDLDLGREWLELTVRPMVWGLLAARKDTLSGAQAQPLVRAVRALEKARQAAVARDSNDEGSPLGAARAVAYALDGYGQAGLEEWRTYLYYAGALDDLPELPFLALPAEQPEQEAPSDS